MHGRAARVARDQPWMHGRAARGARDQPWMHGRAAHGVRDQPFEEKERKICKRYHKLPHFGLIYVLIMLIRYMLIRGEGFGKIRLLFQKFSLKKIANSLQYKKLR
jgi:hypothetical protein